MPRRYGTQNCFSGKLKSSSLEAYSLSRYSPGTSSSGTSRVRSSRSSASPESSTPATIPASKEFPSSSNSSTLSESASSLPDKPCKSPDCPASESCGPEVHEPLHPRHGFHANPGSWVRQKTWPPPSLGMVSFFRRLLLRQSFFFWVGLFPGAAFFFLFFVRRRFLACRCFCEDPPRFFDFFPGLRALLIIFLVPGGHRRSLTR